MSGVNIGTKTTRTNIRDACVYGGFQTDDKLYFRDTGIYIQSDADGYINIVADTGIKLNGELLSATVAEINRSNDTSARVVTTTSSALALTVALHAERIVLVNSNTTFANTFTLPASAGTGEKFTIINNLIQTIGTIVVAAAGTDVMNGSAIVVGTTEEAAIAFVTSATSDKITTDLTTTGGLGGDTIECWDSSAGVWTVMARLTGAGALATPFSASA